MRLLTSILLSATILSHAAASDSMTTFQYFGPDQGLQQNTVYTIARDADGFLWLGSVEGLIRFDGVKFKNYPFNNDNLLTTKRVSQITPDAHHHLWALTYDGHLTLFNQTTEQLTTFPRDPADHVTVTHRHDGSTFLAATQNNKLLIFRFNPKQNTYSLTQSTLNDVLAIYTDDDNNIWIPTGAGIYRISPQQLDSDNLSPWLATSPLVASGAITENRRAVLFGTTGQGILAWDKTSQTITPFCPNSLPDKNITLIQQVYAQGTLVATDNAHLFCIDNTNNVIPIPYHGTDSHNVTGIYVDRQGNAWISTLQKGLTRIALTQKVSKFYHISSPLLEQLLDNERPVFLEDNNNTLWIATCGAGLLRYDATSDSFHKWLANPADNSAIPSNVILDIAQDNTGNIWLAAGPDNSGLIKVIAPNPAFPQTTPVDNPSTTSQNSVRAIAVDSNDLIWVATRDGAYHIFDTNKQLVSSASYLTLIDGSTTRTAAYALKFTSDNRLWIATKGQGIFLSVDAITIQNADINKLRFIRLADNCPQLRESPMNLTYSITEDSDGNVWVATYGAGLIRINTASGSFVVNTFNTQNSKLASNKTRFVTTDHNGNLWIATLSGVNIIKHDELSLPKPKFHSIDLKADVCHILESSRGDIILSTIGKGLTILTPHGNDTTIAILSTHDGLCDNSVYAAAEDQQANLWVSTEKGLNRLSPVNNTVERFNKNDGLPITNFAESVMIATRQGHILAGGQNGFIDVNPLLLNKPKQDQPVILTNLWINDIQQSPSSSAILDTAIAYASLIKLPYSQNTISIEFTTTDLSDPKTINYAYRLLEQGDEWHPQGNKPYLTLDNLSSGKHTLQIRHQKFDGRWSEGSRQLNIIILPPFYATPWAIAIYIILACALAIAVLLVYRRLALYRRLLSDLEDLICFPTSQLATNIQTYDPDAHDNSDSPSPEAMKAIDAEQNRDAQFINDVFKYAYDNHQVNMNIEQVAEHFNMSRSAFYARVRAITGRTPIDILRQAKLQVAADLLRNGHNVSEVATEIGYNDVRYFSKLFKTFFGHTPSSERTNNDNIIDTQNL